MCQSAFPAGMLSTDLESSTHTQEVFSVAMTVVRARRMGLIKFGVGIHRLREAISCPEVDILP